MYKLGSPTIKTVLIISVVCVCVRVCVLSCVQLFVTPWNHQDPLSMEFSRQEYWSGLLVPPPRDLPEPGIEPAPPALAGRFFITALPGNKHFSG